MCNIKGLGPVLTKIFIAAGLGQQIESIIYNVNEGNIDLAITGTIELIIRLMSISQTCFTGDTLVSAEDGQKRIDEIEVGDKVWAYDIYTGKTELKEVLTVYVHDQDEILHLKTTAGDIDTTSNHPFYVMDKGWVAAGDLENGDEVYLIDGDSAVVTGSELEKLDEAIKVYNLEVEGYNTYFVGDYGVLVHNYNQKDIDNLRNGPAGTTVEVKTYNEANKLVKEAFPDYQKVAGVGIDDAQGIRKHIKMVEYKKGGAYHKDYMGTIDSSGKVVVRGHDTAKNPHKYYPHINIKRRDGIEVLINIVGEILGH